MQYNITNSGLNNKHQSYESMRGEVIDVEKLHELLKRIAYNMHIVLDRNNIPYYMLGGSMLGAVRHKDIIPWDDDMDFGIPRPYFSKAIEILKNELPERYRLLTTYDSPRMLGDLCKIEDTKTLIKETAWKQDLKDDMGIFIDLFPLDYSDGKYSFFSRERFIGILVKIQCYRFFSIKPRPLPLKIVAVIIKILLFWIKRYTITNIIKRFLLVKDGNYYANFYGAWGHKETVHISVFGKPKLYPFSNMHFYGVKCYDTYLRSLYGNYMELPPKEKRKAHLAEITYR